MVLMSMRTASVALVGIFLAGQSAVAASESVLYSFAGGNDGAYPFSGLINVGGTFYGTTGAGGGNGCDINGCGTVFSFNLSTGTEAVVHSFVDNPDGAYPYAGLINVNGEIYGTTGAGGLSETGTVFSLNPSTNAEEVVYSMPAKGGPIDPQSNLTYVNHLLFGASPSGGAKDFGTVFSINPATGAETNLHSFANAPSSDPKAFIVAEGTLYGTTQLGGNKSCTGGCGTVFSVKLNSLKYKVVYEFSGGADGANPGAGLLNVGGLLYGTTSNGGTVGCAVRCGTLFSLNPSSHQETPLHSFQGGSDGAGPLGSLIKVGALLYGTTKYGGASDNGTVFSYNPLTGVEKVVYAFQGGNDGSNPISALLEVGGKLYGTTFRGGYYGNGTIFAITP